MHSDFSSVPQELRDRKQWVCWRFEQRGDGKPTKVPVTIGGYNASAVDPSDWYSFDDACEAAHKFAGIGFVFTANDPFVGIDIDNCLLDDCSPKDWAKPILDRLAGSYSEISPSGLGVKVICQGLNPLASGKRVVIDDGVVEIYDRGRFFTITGRSGESMSTENKQDAIQWIADTYFSPKPLAAYSLPPTAMTIDHGDKIARAESYARTMEPAVSGQSGHNACFTAACKILLGFDLSPQQAFDILWNVYNPVCQPPWSEKEIWHKINQADKKTGDRGYILRDRITAEAPGVDLSGFRMGPSAAELNRPEPAGHDGIDDEDWAEAAVPESGLLRDIYDYYCQVSHRKSHVMGLAVAVSLCEMLFGRRIASHTDLRTNDYNVIIAPTNCGKEACEKTIVSILEAANPEHKALIPADVQSGNGLLRSISQRRCALWVSDEFGKVLSSVLDDKARLNHKTQIATHLLKLYGKSDSTYTGAAHSDGDRNHIVQPHLCVLGMTTGSTLFGSVKAENIHDGLFGRIAFWPVQSRPARRRMVKTSPPDHLVQRVRQWLQWEPGGNLASEHPEPPTIDMTPDALARWEAHSDAIDERMESETETRAAIWGRVSARAMKLAMIHFAARQTSPPDQMHWELTSIDIDDVEWGIMAADWLARIACDLVLQNIVDTSAKKNRGVIIEMLEQYGEVTTRDILRSCRRMTAGELMAEAKLLESQGYLTITETKPGGRGRPSVKLAKVGQLGRPVGQTSEGGAARQTGRSN